MQQLMRFKYWLYILVGLGISIGAAAQTTTVSGTVVDQGGQTWAHGTISYVFQNNGSFSGPYQWNGGNLPNQYLTPQIVTLSSGGTFSITIPTSTAIAPALSTWRYVVCPNATAPCAILTVASTGSTQNISSQITAAAATLVGTIQAGPMPLAYTDAEIITTPNQGGIYFNVTAFLPKYFDGTSWQFYGSGGGGGVTFINGISGSFTFNGSGVSCIGTTCTFNGGSGTGLPTATSSGQIISSTAAGNTYAVQGQIFYNQVGDTISSIEAECSSLCTYIVTVPQVITLSANHTLNSNILIKFESGGLWTVNGAFTFTLAKVLGTPDTHFAGSSTIAGLTGAVSPEWFGAVPYITYANVITGTIANTPMQAAANSLASGGWLQFPCAAFRVTTTIQMANVSGTGIRGPCPGILTSSSTTPVSAVVNTTNNTSTWLICGCSVLTFNNYIDGVEFERSVAPTGSVDGILLGGLVSFVGRNFGSYESINPIHLHNFQGGGLTNFQNVQFGWGYSASGYTGQTVSGFFIDTLDGTISAPVVMVNLTGSASPGTNVASTGYLDSGAQVRAHNLYGFNGTNLGTCIRYNSTAATTSGDANAANNLSAPWCDGTLGRGIEVDNLNGGAATPSLSISGPGWIDAAGDNSIYLNTDTAVTVTGLKIRNTGTGRGIYLIGCVSCSIYGNNVFRTSGDNINVTNGEANSIVGNIFRGDSGAPFGNAMNIITSPYNAISGNTCQGIGTTCLALGSGTQLEDIGANSCDPSLITNCATGAGITFGIMPITASFGNFSGNLTSLLNAVEIAPTLASASTIAPSGGAVHVTGVSTISTMTPPTGCTTVGFGCQVSLIADNTWSIGTGGNFNSAITAVTGIEYSFIYDPNLSKWFANTSPTGTITLSGAVTGSGTSSITTTYAGILGSALGGLGINTSTSTGCPSVTSGTWSIVSCAGGGTVTSIATTGPIGGGTITTTGTITCTTCVVASSPGLGIAHFAGATQTVTSSLVALGSDVSGNLPNANLASQTANTVLGALTATTPSGLAVPSCSTASSALTWTTGTGFGCNTISGGSITFPQTIAGTTTSGGIVYFSSTTQISSSGIMAAGDFILGGGAGTAPTATFSVVPIANGGTGAATALTDTVFGNPTGSTAAPVFTNAPSLLSLTVSNNVATPKIAVTSSSGGLSIGSSSGVLLVSGTPFVQIKAGGNIDTNSSATTALTDFQVADTFANLSGSLTVTAAWIGSNFSNTWGTSGAVITYNSTTPMTTLQLLPTFNVSTSSTGHYDGIFFQPTETSIGSGVTNFFWEQKNNAGTTVSTMTAGGLLTSTLYATTTNCASSASPAVCGSAASGAFTIAAATTSIVVNTTAVTANSEIEIQPDSSLGTRLSVTCNTSLATLIGPVVTARTPGTSFTVTITGTLITNPACYTYSVIN